LYRRRRRGTETQTASSDDSSFQTDENATDTVNEAEDAEPVISAKWANLTFESASSPNPGDGPYVIYCLPPTGSCDNEMTFQVPADAQRRILEMVPDQVVRFQSEAQAHHVTEAKLDDVRHRLPDDCEFALGIGMEASSDDVLEYSVNNEFNVDDYHNAARVAHDDDTLLKCYVLVKPPFLTEREAIEEAVETGRKIAGTPALEALSFNPVSVHKNTLVEDLWRDDDYSPPWLWSVAEVLQRVSEFADCQIHSDVVAGGKQRGAHNCGECDEAVLKAIDAHKKTGDASVFDRVECECKESWRDQLDLEGLALAGGAAAAGFREAAGTPGGSRHGLEQWYEA